MLATLKTPPQGKSNQNQLNELVKAIESAVDGSLSDLPDHVCQALKTSFKAGSWLTPAQCEGRDSTYARHVLYEDPEGRFTIVSLVWNPGQASPVHAHHVWCALTVVAGDLQEEFFTYDEQSNTAIQASLHHRRPLDGSYGLPGVTQIHRISNNQNAPAISVHVYGIDGARISTNVNRIFEEKK